MKSKFNAAYLWATEGLVDLMDRRSMLRKRVAKRLYLAIKIIALGWPIVGGAFLAFYSQEIKGGNILLFAKSSSNTNIGSASISKAILFDITTSVWVLCFILMLLLDEYRSARSFERLRWAIIGAPGTKKFQSGRSLFEKTYSYRKMKFNHTDGSDMDELDNLTTRINLYVSHIVLAAKDYFSNEEIKSANVMVYLDKLEGFDEVFKVIPNISKQIYFRCDFEKKIEGVLFLVSRFIYKENNEDKIPSINIPVYSSYEQVFKFPNSLKSEFVIPGALLALKDGTAMVNDTWNIKKYYSEFDDRTVDEIKSHFNRKGLGSAVRSFVSMRIPSPEVTGGRAYSGVFNIDSPRAFAFGEDDEYFTTFYTIVYPTLMMIAEELATYKTLLKQDPSLES
jgi:hypothetical protein